MTVRHDSFITAETAAEPTFQWAAWVASLVAVVAFLGLGCSTEEPIAPELPRPVRTVRVTVAENTVQRSLAGTARAGIESRLSFRVPGSVEEVAVRLGDRVARGQVLARLDATDYELRVEEAAAALAQARAALRRAEADYERTRALYENDNASKRELDAARASAESSQAQVEAMGRRLEQARQQVGYAVLRAPLAGAIASVDVEVNENVQAGHAVFLLTAGDRPEVEVAVPEVLIDRLTVGQPVTVTFDAIPGRRYAGRVAEVGVAKTGRASTFQVICRLEEADERVRAGLAGEVRFALEAPGNAGIRVPSVAVGEDREGPFVFVVEPEGGERGTVHRRSVTPGAFDGDIEIRDGLESGELVVTAGVRRLSDGMAVRLLPEPTEAGGSAGSEAPD